MLIGEYYHSIDSKGRIIMPQKFRQDLGASFVICKGFDDNCLFAYSNTEWAKLTTKIESLPLAKRREVVRFIYSGATEAEPDNQGRVIVPITLRTYGTITKDVAIIGAADHVEIWDKSCWDTQVSKLSPHMVTEIMQELDF